MRQQFLTPFDFLFTFYFSPYLDQHVSFVFSNVSPIMKRPKRDDNPKRKKTSKPARTRRNDEQVTELLKMCLEKVCELQADLERTGEHENDPEAAGYSACAAETLRFLSAEGLPPDHPVVKGLAERLLGNKE